MLTKFHLPKLMRKRWFSAKCMVKMNEAVNTQLGSEELNPKHHPGIMKTGTVQIPNWIVQTMVKIIGDVPVKAVCTEGVKLAQYLKARQPPIDEEQLQSKVNDIEKSLLGDRKLEDISAMELENLRKTNKGKAAYILKQRVYAWTALQYDSMKSLYYMAGRAAQDYAVLYKIFYEIHARDQQFQPKTLLDYGSGIGTVVWAASQFWAKTLQEQVCVDCSSDMNDLAESLLKGQSPNIKGIFYRQFLATSANPQYEIVVSAYSLLELPSLKARLELILKLWRKTSNYLVIVENGTNAGFKVVNEARDFILEFTNRQTRNRAAEPVHIFAPCPHELECPRFFKDNTPCNFEVSYSTLPLRGSSEVRRELYSYVVLKKGSRPEADEQWPRIVRPTLIRSKHTICRMCTASGKLQEVIFTASKHGKYTYRCARSSKWGDMLPLQVTEIDAENETAEQTIDN